VKHLEETLAAIHGLDAPALRAAERRQARLTKPRGSLGALERVAVRLAGITGLERPRFARRVIVVAAASHGVAAEEEVSAYPASVTAQMVANFVAGGAAINVLADAAGAELVVVDAGVEPEPASHPRLRRCRLGPGSRNLRRERALPPGHGRRIVEAGVALVAELDTGGAPWLLALGEMGIGNTTASAAIVAAACAADVAQVTGRGTLVDDARLARKREVVREALALHQPDPRDGFDLLESVGGYEIGFLAGCCLGAAARRVPVVLDGLITGAAALVAAAIAPACRDALIAGHRSVEPGHRVALDALGLEPLLDLDLRLGEGSGAALALPLVAAAARTLDEMATFEEAGVDERA
jgi:nicotinate-nucleotide--dimethylbenzimidazole phosphoribosyltransferase